MKKTITTVIAICIIGCGGKTEAKTPSTTTKAKTVDQLITEIKSTRKVVVVPNTEHIDYTAYRLEWRRVNDKHAPKWAPDVTASMRTTKKDDHEIVEIELSDLKFKDAFRIEFLGKGEGHTFWWRGNEYTTNLLDVIRRPGLKQTDPFIEKVVVPVTVPVDEEDLLEGGGDQGTTEE